MVRNSGLNPLTELLLGWYDTSKKKNEGRAGADTTPPQRKLKMQHSYPHHWGRDCGECSRLIPSSSSDRAAECAAGSDASNKEIAQSPTSPGPRTGSRYDWRGDQLPAQSTTTSPTLDAGSAAEIPQSGGRTGPSDDEEAFLEAWRREGRGLPVSTTRRIPAGPEAIQT